MMKRIGILLCCAAHAAPLAGQSQERPRLLEALHLPVRYVRAFGQRLAYYEAGPRRAPTVILLPNLGWSSNQWAQNLPALARRYHVLAIDPLGLGRSDKPLIDYRMQTWTDGFAELMRLKRVDRAAFVGSVMGGALAVQMALDYPQRVSAIVVAGSSSGPGPHEGGAASPPSALSLAGVRAGLREAFFDSTLVTDSVVRARLAQRLAAGDGYTIQRHLADHRPPYTTAELAHVEVPALFVWCREDVTTPLSWGRDYAAALPHGRLEVIDRCGHFPNLERPAAFDEVVMRFLAGALSGSALAPGPRP